MIYSNGCCLDFESREALLKLRSEIIEKCSEIIHHDYEGIHGPNCRDSLKIRNYIRFVVSDKEERIYRFVYEEYKFPYLVTLIDKILQNDFTVLNEIIEISYNKELISIHDKVAQASLELDNINNLNIVQKRNKLDELEKYLEQLKYNKNQESIFPYYEKVLDILGIEYVNENSCILKHVINS